MPSTAPHRLGPRLAFGAVLIAASIALVGCGAVAPSSSSAARTPAPTHSVRSASHYTVTPSASAGDVYRDSLAGYAVAFPGEPDVKPLAISGTDRLANLAAYGDPSNIFFIARGEVRDSPPDLHGELLGWLQSVQTSGSVGASSDELKELPALRAEFTMATGEAGETVVASDGNRFYQLIAIGGTPKARQAYFDTFSLTGR
jgi:hypothetical protein